MDLPLQTFLPLCTLNCGGQRHLCLSQRHGQNPPGLGIVATNGIDVWRMDLTAETLDEWNAAGILRSSSGDSEHIREMFEQSAPLLEIQGSAAILTFPLNSGSVTLDLFKLPISETRTYLQTLLFNLFDRVKNVEKIQREGSVATSASPVKSTLASNLMLVPDVESRRRGYGISATNVKKRAPGESLVNPGCKRKKAAKGVDFEES
ncbi:protein PAXX [Pelodytes ibericus]